MNIKILYDNRSGKDGMLSGWGFSCLVDGKVLVDTGEDGKKLINNMEKMAVDIGAIKEIVISHDHWDHTGGLEDVLKRGKDITVYGCAGFSGGFKDVVKRYGARLAEEKFFSGIRGNIYVSGVFSGEHKGNMIEEEAVVIKTFNGITIITGCAHPGILRIVERVESLFPQEKIYCVFGGFHLGNIPGSEVVSICERLAGLGIRKAGPAHCSGTDGIRIFKSIFGEGLIEIAAGVEIEV